jgi:hypothetical protein
MLDHPCWRDLDRTDPFRLQPTAPSIDDTQRSAVLRAEEAAKRGLKPWPMTEGAVLEVVEDVTRDGRPLTVHYEGDGEGVEYWRSQGLLVVEASASILDVVHEASHHAVDAVFPTHGVEWVNGFLRLLRSHCGAEVADAYLHEFDAANVHRTVEWQLYRLKKTARGKTNKERGAVARIIMDGPPQQVVCQLLEMHDSGLLVLNADGEEVLPFERVRYLACVETDRSRKKQA